MNVSADDVAFASTGFPAIFLVTKAETLFFITYACALVNIEASAFTAFVIRDYDAVACAGIRVEIVTFSALCFEVACTIAIRLIEEVEVVICNFAVVSNDALALTRSFVELVALVASCLGVADALTALLVEDIIDSLSSTVISDDAFAHAARNDELVASVAANRSAENAGGRSAA